MPIDSKDQTKEIEDAFARYMALDAEELEAAAIEAQDRAAVVDESLATARRSRRGARPSESEVERAIIEDGAAAWSEALVRARSAGESDIAGKVLGDALAGDPLGLDAAVARAGRIAKEELESQIASAGLLGSLLGAAGTATFRLPSAHPLALAQFAAAAAVGSAITALRAELASRLSAADGDLNTKSTRNRARRAREWASALPDAEQGYQRAAARLPGLAWAGDVPPRAEDRSGIQDADARGLEVNADPVRVQQERVEQAVTAARDLKGLGRDKEAARAERLARTAADGLAAAQAQIADGKAPEAKDGPQGEGEEQGLGEATRAEGPSKGGRREGEAPGFAKASFPVELVHPYASRPDRNGRVWDKAVVNMPVKADLGGVSLAGYSADVFLKGFHKEAIAEGRNLVFGFREDEPVRLFAKGRPDIQADPWALATAVKAAKDQTDPRPERDPARAGYVRITFPSKWAHAYKTKPNAQGRTFEKAVVNIPAGTMLSGRSLDGYSADVFLKGFHKDAIAAGEPVTFGFREDEPVRLFAKGRPDIQADPWALATAVKASRQAFGDGTKAKSARMTPDAAMKAAESIKQGADAPARTPAPSK